MKRKNVTIKDIAQYAGVSTMTVSYVLNKNSKQTISEATRKKVLEAVETLHYVPSNTAKALRSNKTQCIGVYLCHSTTHKRYSLVLDGLRSYLNKYDYHVLLCSNTTNLSMNGIPEYLNCYLNHKADGIIYVGRDGIDIPPSELDLIENYKIPVTAIDCKNITPDISSVDFNYYQSAFQHALYLLENGANNLVYLRAGEDTLQEREREFGLKEAVSRYPNATLSICRIPLAQMERNTNFSEPNDTQKLFSHLRTLSQEQCSRLSGRDAIICGWGLFVEEVYAEVMKLCPTLQVAGLAEGSLDVDIWKNLSYSVIPSFHAGQLCAELMLQQIDHAAVEKKLLETRLEYSK